MSMIDDASDETKEAVKHAQKRRQSEPQQPEQEGPEQNERRANEEGRQTDGDVPVANLE